MLGWPLSPGAKSLAEPSTSLRFPFSLPEIQHSCSPSLIGPAPHYCFLCEIAKSAQIVPNSGHSLESHGELLKKKKENADSQTPLQDK